MKTSFETATKTAEFIVRYGGKSNRSIRTKSSKPV